MNKKNIITALLALVAITGQAQVKCHIEGKFVDNKWGDEVVICKIGTDLRVNDAPEWHHKAVNGRFECDIETDVPEMYERDRKLLLWMVPCGERNGKDRNLRRQGSKDREHRR